MLTKQTTIDYMYSPSHMSGYSNKIKIIIIFKKNHYNDYIAYQGDSVFFNTIFIYLYET